MDYDVERITSFWFDDRYGPERWFAKSTTLDNEIRTQFGDLVAQARTSSLDKWTSNPQSTLAMLLLLDQFPRNIFRDSPEAFASDKKASNISIRAIARGFDRHVEPLHQPFFYLPLIHDEQLVSQVAAVSLYEGLVSRAEAGSPAHDFANRGVGFTRGHMDIIAAFGRFPGRNAALGRQSTAEELEFLGRNPSGLGPVAKSEL